MQMNVKVKMKVKVKWRLKNLKNLRLTQPRLKTTSLWKLSPTLQPLLALLGYGLDHQENCQGVIYRRLQSERDELREVHRRYGSLHRAEGVSYGPEDSPNLDVKYM